MRYSKPEGFTGRGEGSTNWRMYKWEVSLNGEYQGKYVSINDVNDNLGLNLNCEKVWRLTTGKKVDASKRNKENSFLARYGHIDIKKIKEFKEGVTIRDTRKTFITV